MSVIVAIVISTIFNTINLEYSRRWLILSESVTFDSVDIAVEIWNLTTVTSITNENETFPFVSYVNGETKSLPKVGCLMIYNTDLAYTGHVAVIVDFTPELISIGEQNWFNDHWPSPSQYARQVNMTKDAQSESYTINDEFLIGWKCVEK